MKSSGKPSLDDNPRMMLPASDGLYLGETLTPRRWDGSKLFNVLLQDGSKAMTGDLDLGSNRLLFEGGGGGDAFIGWDPSQGRVYSHYFMAKAPPNPARVVVSQDRIEMFSDSPHILMGLNPPLDVDMWRDVVAGAGVLSISGLKLPGTFYVDCEIQELNPDTGVTIDGVLCKDGGVDINKVLTPNLRLSEEIGADYLCVRNRTNTAWKNLALSVLSFRTAYGGFGCQESPIYFSAKAAQGGVVNFRTYYPNTYDVAKFVDGYFQIMRGGDIDLLDDKFIKIGKDSDGTLPTAGADYRGKMIRVEGGAGEADKLYMCMKSAADTYSWVQIAIG